MKKNLIPVLLTSALTALVTFFALGKFSNSNLSIPFISSKNDMPVHYTSYNGLTSTQPVDFTIAAENTVKAVVHIKTLTEGQTVIARNPYNSFFDRAYRIPEQVGSGSGVLISEDGYIVTNNHVVQGTDKVQVTFNNRNTQIAKVVGTDPATDLAVLKIEGSQFPYLTFGNSDEVKLGQWVLAVGYPLNLDATVTAGIVSAKSRSIGINQKKAKNAIESFIQTDAAVNPGNSGGALVNTAGLLIGINSAIASPTGSYAGYSYAIPSNIVQKVAADIIKYGDVQRGYLGIQPVDLNDLDVKTAAQIGLSPEDFKNANGVFIYDVVKNTGADKAGLKKGDFITKINNVEVNTVPELLEQVARYAPGDKLNIDYIRGNKNYATQVELKNQLGTTTASNTSSNSESVRNLGAQFRNLTAEEMQKYNLEGGVVVTKIERGVLQEQTNIRPGFIIFGVNSQSIKDISEFQNALKRAGKRLQLAGSYPNRDGIYYYGINQ